MPSYDYSEFPTCYVWPCYDGYDVVLNEKGKDVGNYHFKTINDVVYAYCLNYTIVIFPEVGVRDEV